MKDSILLINKKKFPWEFNQSLNWPKANYPRLSVIIPSYNQDKYIEETLLSVINQQYPNLELIVIDGGSTDKSVDIIKEYDSSIDYWVSEKDRGQSHAVNKGLAVATGEWIAWINSDDCYTEGALHYIFNELPYNQFDFLYGQCYTGSKLSESVENCHPLNAKKELKDILLFFYHVSHIIPSQSVFIRKELVDKVGYLKEDLHYCMDFDWYCRMYLQTNRRLFYDKTVCFYRINPHTKTGSGHFKASEEALKVASFYSKYLNEIENKKILRLIAFIKDLNRCVTTHDKGIFSLFVIFLKYPEISLHNISLRIALRKKILSLITKR